MGAHEFPGPNVVLDPAALEGFLAAHRVVYVTGPPGDRIFAVQLSGIPSS